MLHCAPSTVRRRSASLLVHNQHHEDLRSSNTSDDGIYRLVVQDNAGNRTDERDIQEHSEACVLQPCSNDYHNFCGALSGEEHDPCRQKASDFPPAFSDRDHSPSSTTDPIHTTSEYSAYGHPRLLPSGKLKLTHKWPTPSTLKYFISSSASCHSDGPPSAPILEQGQGPSLPFLERWTPSKMWLVFSTMTVFAYGTTLLLWASVTWLDAWAHADVMTVADHDILILVTVTATLVIFSAMMGISGAILNSRRLLAIYTLLLWPDQMTILAVGYIAYKRVTFNFDRKTSFAWSRLYTVQGRQIIQDSFGCCGFYNALHEIAPSKRCYVRASVPGCRNALFEFERKNLTLIWKVAFALAAVHIFNMVIALLCSNHVSKGFGKGLTPPQYRLCSADIKAKVSGEQESNKFIM